MLHGALAARPAPSPAFGADAARLQQALDVLETRLGRDTVADLRRRGGRLGDEEVVARPIVVPHRAGPVIGRLSRAAPGQCRRR